MIRRNKIPLIVIGLGFLLLSCKKETEIIKEVDLSPFLELETSGVFNVVLEQGDEHKIILKGDEKVVENIAYEISLVNGKERLIVDNNSKKGVFSSNGIPTIHITYDTLYHYTVRNSVNLRTTNTMRCSRFSIYNYAYISEVDMDVDVGQLELVVFFKASGIFKYKGRATKTIYTLKSGSKLVAENLVNKQCYIEQSSVIDAIVSVEDTIRAKIFGSGHVVNKDTDPYINLLERTSTGDVKKQ